MFRCTRGYKYNQKDAPDSGLYQVFPYFSPSWISYLFFTDTPQLCLLSSIIMSDLEQTANPIENRSIEEETENSDHKAQNSNASSTLQGHDAEKASQPKPSGSDPPDGGTVAWLVILGAWCISFCSFGWLNSNFFSYRMKHGQFMLTINRYWCLPGVLRNRTPQVLLPKYYLMDPFASNLLYDGNGGLSGRILVLQLLICHRDPWSVLYTITMVRDGCFLLVASYMSSAS